MYCKYKYAFLCKVYCGVAFHCWSLHLALLPSPVILSLLLLIKGNQGYTDFLEAKYKEKKKKESGAAKDLCTSR